jgi:hypothetical protein
MKPAEFARRVLNGEFFWDPTIGKYILVEDYDIDGNVVGYDEDHNDIKTKAQVLEADTRSEEEKRAARDNLTRNMLHDNRQQRENRSGETMMSDEEKTAKMTYEEKAIKAMELISEGKIEEAIDIFHVTELPRFRDFLHVENQIPSRVHMDYSGVKDPNLREFLEKSYIKYMTR